MAVPGSWENAVVLISIGASWDAGYMRDKDAVVLCVQNDKPVVLCVQDDKPVGSQTY